MNDYMRLVETGDGSLTLYHEKYSEEFHSRGGALTEARELYINASGFGDASCSFGSIEVLDVGLGLGYNALTTIDAWVSNGTKCDLRIISLEKDSFLVGQIVGGDAPWMRGWSDGWRRFSRFLRPVKGGYKALWRSPTGALLTWVVMEGNAQDIAWDSEVDRGINYVWQDAFSPSKNPELWGYEWFSRLRDNASPTGMTLMSYSVARGVRDSLLSAGYHVEKINAYGAKRHWLKSLYQKN